MPRSRLERSGFRESFLIAATGDDVAFGSKGEISADLTHVRFTPQSGHSAARIRRDGFPRKYDLSEGARAEMLACAEPNLE
jgi:hypothetical protein